MSCATVRGQDAPLFGISNDEGGLYTTSIKVTHKNERKEVRNKCGNVFAVAYYNRTSEIEVSGVVISTFSMEVGDAFPLSSTINPAPVNTASIDEITADLSNEDYQKITVKATAYAGFSA